MSSDPSLSTHRMGATQISIGLGVTATPIMPGPRQNGGIFKIISGSGTLCIVDGPGFSTLTGYPVGSAEIVSYSGPAVFYLSAASATMTIALSPSYSSYAGVTGLTL